MKNKVLKTAIAIVLIVALTIADFILVGMNLVTYAFENINNSTNNENVKFAAYFKTEEEEKTQIEYEITNSEMKLHFEIEVEEGVNFDGVITLGEGSNFKFKNKLSQGISKIEENTITLETIKKGNTAQIEVGIEPVIEENYGDSMLNKESVLSLQGNYKDSTEKITSIEAEKRVTLSLIAPSNIDTTLETKVITNRVYKIEEVNKRLVQIELSSKVVDNAYPVDSTTFEIALPEGVENVEVISKGTYATNGEADKKIENYTWDKENKLLHLEIENNSQDGTISWKKDAQDSIIVTLTLPEDSAIGEEEYNIKSKVKLYGQEASLPEKALTYNLAEEADGIIRAAIENKEVIYKGKLYSQEEREYKGVTNIEVNYANLVETVTVNEKAVYRLEENLEDKIANIIYKTTTISKTEFDKILGTEGIITIKDQNGNIVKEVKTTDFDENGSLTIVYSEEVKSLTIEITKPVETGIIRLNHTKAIKENGYTEQEIDQIKYLVEQVEVNYSTAKYNFERIKTLLETTSEVGITVEAQSISAEENNEMPIAITLKTDNEKYELFENPTFTLTMPEGVTVNSVSDGAESKLFGGLAISKLEVINSREIRIEISGTQTEYVKSNINSQINFTANVVVEKLMPNKIETVKMQYENKGNTYSLESEEINVIASNAKIVTNLKVENYNGLGTTIEKYSDRSLDITGELPLDNAQTMQVPVKYTIINNYDSAIAIMPTITATFTNQEDNQEKLINYENQEIVIEAKSMQVIEQLLEVPAGLHYSETIDIETTVEYTYSGTEYNVRNNIELATETKEGIRDTSIIDDKVQVETFAQLGNGNAVKAEDEIYNEQIIQYIIEVTNISNEKISNLKVTNKQDNGNIYDLKEIEVINEVVSDDILIEHEYAELEDTEKTFTIDALNPGEAKELLVRVVAKKVQPDNITTANISISADTIENRPIQTISNQVKDSDLKITVKNGLTQEVKMYGKGQLYILTDIKNLTDNQIQNIKGKMYLSEGLTFPESYELKAVNEEAGFLEILQNVKYNEEENYIEFEITTLEPNQLITISSALYIKSIPLEQLSTKEMVYCDIDNIISNSVQADIKQLETEFSVVQTTNINENQKVKDDETIIITGEITNTGYVDSAIYIEDNLPTGLEVVKVELIRNGKVEDKTAEVQGEDVIVFTQINAKETITIKIEAKVNTTRIAGELVTNTIVIMDTTGKNTNSNEVTIQIDSDIENNGGIEEPDIENPENTDPENKNPEPEKPNEPDKPDEPGTGTEGGNQPGDGNEEPEVKTFTISGHAWVDKNENNTKDDDEVLKDIIVKIIDLNNQNTFVKDESGNEIEVKTDKNGMYEIKGILEGNYNLIFKYSTSTYELKGNSEVKDYIIESTKEKVAITNNINLNENKTIDLVLMELNEFDLKIDKYISKVIVQTVNGTKTTEYEKQQLVKEEIQKKYLVGATVLVEYTMEITNIGELAGYATEIVDYLPNDMKFYSELNTQWYAGEDGNLYNTTLASVIINPGETKTIKLILSKTMNKENTGTTSNIVEISDAINSKEYNDIDSNNNQSKAEIVINIATGTIITYLVAVLNSVVIVAIGMYMIKKKVVGKG